jgi:hypothetical protein
MTRHALERRIAKCLGLLLDQGEIGRFVEFAGGLSFRRTRRQGERPGALIANVRVVGRWEVPIDYASQLGCMVVSSRPNWRHSTRRTSNGCPQRRRRWCAPTMVWMATGGQRRKSLLCDSGSASGRWTPVSHARWLQTLAVANDRPHRAGDWRVPQESDTFRLTAKCAWALRTP